MKTAAHYKSDKTATKQKLTAYHNKQCLQPSRMILNDLEI